LFHQNKSTNKNKEMTTKEIIKKAIKDGFVSEFDLMFSNCNYRGIEVGKESDLDKLNEVELNNLLKFLRGQYKNPKF